MSTEVFAPDRPYRLSPSVALRPEPFGALVYDFTTRKLSFLKTRLLVDVVRALEDASDARDALRSAEVPADDHDRYLDALAGLASAGTIEVRGD
ncbi:mycofactocin biosynthesis chaperone MftB [Prauserella rugosa]|uniref:Putative mycofactocin binding protein MftB n=1 Tax=Prauserella rugosa TaxID=43354 RepID=A0A660CLI7_9PSEU|nr:mycofactocin biosynthesis chaperone MftB [Prauserella rugosa]KID30967.1 putative mycofactocin binding protein MftB [Prauserella sp. Am3]KMS92707.1 mycofactocin system RPExFGAL protein [Streptomyces regensis]TWH22747.1 putative mycofactocin binding protein MftB [Prauserella rugosa]